MNLRTIALREIVIPPSTFDFSQSTSLCQGEDLFEGFHCCLAGWCGGGKHISGDFHLPLVYDEIHWWSPDEGAVS